MKSVLRILPIALLTVGCDAHVNHSYMVKTLSRATTEAHSVSVQCTTVGDEYVTKKLFYHPFNGIPYKPGATGFIVTFKSNDRPHWLGIVNLSASYRYEDGPIRKARVVYARYGSKEWDNDQFAAYVIPESNLLRKNGRVSRVMEPGTYELIFEYDIALKRHRETVTVEYSDTARVEFEWDILRF